MSNDLREQIAAIIKDILDNINDPINGYAYGNIEIEEVVDQILALYTPDRACQAILDEKDKTISNQMMKLNYLGDIVEEQDKKLGLIKQWCEAYPLDIFPEPDFKKAAKVLKENGITIDSISASNMRHVLKGIQRIIGKFPE